MYTTDDVKKMLAGYAGENNFSPARANKYTADDVKNMLGRVTPSQRTIDVEVNKDYIRPVYEQAQTVKRMQENAVKAQQADQRTANYNKLQNLAAGNGSQSQTFADPEAAYIADYKAKYGGSDFAAGLAYKLDNSKILTAADKLMKATNPIAATYRTAQAAEDVINTAVNGKPAEPYELGQAYIREADKARQEFRDMTGNGFASNVALAAGDMLASAGTAGMMGAGFMPFLATTSGIQTAGEDVNKGRGVIPSALHGVGSGGITYLTEGLGGIGQTKLGQSIISKITSVPAIKKAIETASPKVAKYLGNSIVRFIANAGQESLEEAIEYPAQKLLENIIFDDATPFDVKEWWNNTVVGGGVGGLFGLSNLAVNKFAEASVAQPVTRVQDSVQGITQGITQGMAQGMAQGVTTNAESVIGAEENPANSQTVGDLQGESVSLPIDRQAESMRSGLEAMRVSGLVDNNEARAVNRRTRRALNAMGNKLGVKIMFDNTLSGENGRYDPAERTIHIALDSQDPIGVVATHEITHRLKETSPEIYRQFKQTAFDIMRENGSYDNVMAAVADAYVDSDPAIIEDEMAAHFTRIMTEDISVFEQLAGVNRNLAQKLLDMLDELLRKAGWNDSMNAALDSLFGDADPQKLNKVRQSWREAIARADAGAVAGNDIKRSLPITTKNQVDTVEEAANAAGYNVRAYHGTARGDRVGNMFLPERATSGPMAFFTDNRGIAENYARDKADTSLAYDEEYEDYYSQFRVNKNGKSIKVQDLWRNLPFSEKQRIKEAGKHITLDDEAENIIWDDNATRGLGNWDSYTLNAHKGNAIEALIDSWLESGELWGHEGDFIKVLELAGIKGVEYRDPDARYEKVYDTWLNIQNPFNTANVDKTFADGFEKWYSQQPEGKYDRDTSGADMWDKNSQTAYTFLERLQDDIDAGTSHAWTSIPDSVTDYLKYLGYDGIKDTGGKGGGENHTVWIPFASGQVKSAEPITYDDNGNIIPLSERFNPDNPDIRWSRPLDPNAINRKADILAPLRERMQRATAPHPQLGGSRTAGDSAISHLGEAGAFDDVKNLLNTAASEKKKRGMGEKDKIADIADTNDMKKPRVNLQDIAQASYRKFVDSGERVSKIAKATGDKVLYPLFNNAKQARQTAQYNIGVAQTNIKGERIGKSVQEIIQPIKAKGDDYWKAFEEYIYHNHNIDSMTLSTRGAAVLQSFIEDLEAQNPILQGKSVEEVEELRRQPQHKEAAAEWIMLKRRMNGIKNKPVFGKKMTAEKSKQIVGQLLFDHPEFEDFGNEVIGYYRNLINNNVDAGLISAKERDILQQLYPNYVPVMTIQSNTVADRNNRRAAVADVHKARTANNKLLMPIDEAMARKTLTSIAAQRRNIFGVRLLEQALVNRYLIGRDVQSVQDTDIPYDMDAEEEPNLPNSFRVWVDGQPAEMAVSNELMEGVNSIMPKQDDGNLFEQLLGKGNNAFKRAVTSDNPFFAISNILRDVQDAVFYSEQDLKKFFGNYGNAIKEMKNNGKYWQLYQAMGGTGNSYFDYAEGVKLPDEYSGILGKVRKGREKIEALNLYTEQAPRLAEFMGVIEKGGESYENVQKALLAAADITTNFGRSGETGKRLNKSYVPFFNPSVQGADKFVRNIVNKVEEEKWGKLIAQFAGAVLPAFWNMLMWWDDEEYDLLPDNVKDNYYLVKAGNGIWLRFPKGRAIMPATNAAERMARAARGEDGAWDGYWASTMQSVAPNNPLTDNLASPIIESRIWDKNDPGRTWYGGEIEPQRLQNVAAGQRYDEKTDVLSKEIGGLLDISPKKINYLLDAYSGVYGDVYMAVPGVTPQAKRVPLVNRFYTDSVTNNRLSNDFYDALEEAKIGFNTDYNAGDRAEYQSLNKASRGLSDFHAAERDIQTSDLSRSEKLEQSRKLSADRNAFILEALEIAQREREKAESKFAGISQTDYAKAYKAQKEFSKNVDKEKAIARAVPHLSSSQRKRLYDEFKNK